MPRKKKKPLKYSPLVIYCSLGIFIFILGMLGGFQLGRMSVFRKIKGISSAPPRISILPTAPYDVPNKITIPIITYHYVENMTNPKDITRIKLSISPIVFEEELITLKTRNYETLFTRDIPDILKGYRPIPAKAVVLTFDDGYQDFYDVVFPLLKKYNMRATLYVINNFINTKGFLTDSELQEVVDSGLVEIGAHTLHHAYLKTEPDAVAYKEIVESKADLEKRLHIKVESFAYPFGAFNPLTPLLVEKAHYTNAVTTLYGKEHTKDTLFVLRRIRTGYLAGENLINVLNKN